MPSRPRLRAPGWPGVRLHIVTGKGGTGKTTVARMVVGLLPPSSGEVIIDGVSMSNARQLQARQQLRRRIQMIFQDPYASLNPRWRVEDIIAEMRAGRMVILVDEEDRENEGDLVLAADHVTPEAINFMAKFGRGLICLTLTRERCELLKLPPMAARNGAQFSTAFTVSIEAAEGVTTGISAADRSRTVQAAVAKNAQVSDLVQPGHIFPLQAVDGGVLMRAGHTEAGCDLSALAGCSPAAVICEIMNDDGTMARLPDLLDALQARLGSWLASGGQCRGAWVKVRFADFRQTTVEDAQAMLSLSALSGLLQQALARGAQPVRLLGVGVRLSAPTARPQQLELFAAQG